MVRPINRIGISSKVGAAAVGTQVVKVFAWILSISFGLQIPVDVQLAFTGIFAFAFGYFVRDNQ